MPYTEKGAVEDFIIQELQKLGWRYIPAREMNALREGELDQPLLTKFLKDAICKINRNFSITDSDLDSIICTLNNIPPNLEGIRKLLDILKQGLLVYLEGERKERVIRLVDYDELSRNDFIVTNQFDLEGLRASIRADIVLFVNGIPLVLIECKSPTREEISWLDAYRQIKRYEKETPDLFKYVQFSIATDGITTRYFPNFFGEEGEERNLLSEWKDPYPFPAEDFKDDILKTTIYGMLYPPNLLDLVENFIFIRRREDRMDKVMARYQQFRASNKIYKRVIDTLQGRDNKKFGLIWHWQGSGKTYTMAFSAWKLFHSPQAERPTIIVMVDRKDLEEQIERDFAFIGVNIERIPSIRKLIETLRWGKEGKRGIFLVTVEKFRQKEFDELEKAGEGIEIRRENVVILADEVHRTQYGKFRTLWSSILPNAFVFGFTGTPLSKPERNTFQKFCPPSELYLDRYSMADSLQDGFTVHLSYQARLPEYHLNLEQLEDFAKFEEGEIKGLSPEELKALRRRVRVIKSIAKKPERVERIARDIVEFFKEMVEPTGLKAMLVAIDREACVLYKNALDKLLSPEESEIVMTFSPNEREPMASYLLKLEKEYSTNDMKLIHERIRYNFKMRENPKILIVTDMLITGFDAPNLWTMFLDKPLREHRLLQAIARTNRPYSTKMFGLIIDYIGVLEELQKALAQFEASDVQSVVIRDLGREKEEFERLLKELSELFEGVRREDTRESMEEALNLLVNPDVAKSFEEKVRMLMKYYEMLGGEAFLKPYLREYDWLVRIFVAYNKKFKRAGIDELKIEELSKKTIRRIQETIDVKKIEDEYPLIEIDERFIRSLKGAFTNIGTAIDVIANLRRGIENLLNLHPSSQILLNLRQEIEATYEALRYRRIKVEEAYERVKQVSERIMERGKEEEEIGRDKYPIYEVVKSILPNMSKEKILELVESLKTILSEKKLLFKGWHLQKGVKQEVRKEMRFILLKWLRDSEYGSIKSKIADSLEEPILEALKEVVG